MRIVLLTAAGPWSGAEVHTIHLAAALKARGHDVVIVELGRRCYTESPQQLPCAILHLDISPGLTEETSLEVLGFSSWLRLFSNIKGDVAILVKGNFEMGSLAMDAAAKLRFPRYLVIEHMHAPLPKRERSRHFRGLMPGLGLWWYRAKLMGYLRSIFPHKIFCVSHAVASTLRKDYGYPSSKLNAVHSGVDTNRFVPSSIYRDLARKAWGIPETAFVFGTLGRLSPMKNHGQLISAFSQFCNHIGKHDIRLVIAGEGPLRSALEAQAHSTGVGKQVIFSGFSANPERVYPAFDVFCFPSTSGESLGIALLEAMSCGCPPIAAATGGVPEILNDPQLGWLINSGNERALFSAMQLAYSLKGDRLQQVGTNARKRALGDFNAVDRWNEWVTVVEAAIVH